MGKKRTKMPISERAKQFMPFSPLVGLEKALREKEKILVGRKELSEDEQMELSRKINVLEKGQIVLVTYFWAGEYIVLKGRLEKIDKTFKKMFVGKTEISFENVIEIEPYTD